MNIDLQPKKVSALLPTDIPFQTAYWSEVKSRLGWQPAAFDYRSSTGQYLFHQEGYCSPLFYEMAL